MRDTVPPCGTTGGGGAPESPPMPPGPSLTITPADPAAPSAPSAPGGDSGGPSRPAPAPQRPQRPLASHPGDALGRPRNNPPDEEDPPEQTATTTFTPHAFKTTPEQLSGACRGGNLSESVAKALRGAIGREKKRGISTFLLRCSGSIRVFATDLDNLPPRILRGGRPRGGRRPRRAHRRPDGARKDAPRSRRVQGARVQGALSAARPRGSTSRLAPIPTKPRMSRTSHASRLGSVHPLRGSSGAGNGALGGSFRPALDHAAIRTAQSRGNFRMHPECRPERSSQGARTGGQRGPRARRRRGPR